METVCKVCGKDFSSLKSLHGHLKAHKLVLMEYYPIYFPRKNLLTGDQIPFKNYEQYFSTEFSNRSQMEKWLGLQPQEISEKYCIDKLKQRIEKKNMEYAPCHIDLQTSKMPSLDHYKSYCGSYKNACDKVGLKQRFTKPIPKDFFNSVPNKKIICDTREQLPIKFENFVIMKLDFGDYALFGEDYNYIFVDRKAEGDFKGSFGKDINRVKRELDRVREFGGYIFFLVENSIRQIKANNASGPTFKRSQGMENIFFNTRSVMNEYGDVCQILFVNGRKEMSEMIQRLLVYGPELKSVDVQYFLDKHYELDSRISEQA